MLLLQRYSEDMELEDAIHTALLTLREGFEGEMTASNIELGAYAAHPLSQHLQRYAASCGLGPQAFAPPTPGCLSRLAVVGMVVPSPPAGIIGADKKFRVLTAAEVADYLAEAD